MDIAIACAIPYLRNAAGRKIAVDDAIELILSPKIKTSLVLAFIAAAFFIGMILRHWL